MKKILLAILTVAIASWQITAQQISDFVIFEKTMHNFGTIKEENGKVSFKFEFTNKGKVPAIITGVEASCGCTTPTWSKAPVPPNAKGFVNAEFDPNMRPGNFNKEVTVTFADKTVIKLKITGDVIGKDKSIADVYKYEIGDLRLRSLKVPFAKIKSSETRKEHLEIANTTNSDLKVTFKDAPSHLQLKADPEVLKPNQTGAIEITYIGSKKAGTGFLKDNIKVVVNGKEPENNAIQISATKVQ